MFRMNQWISLCVGVGVRCGSFCTTTAVKHHGSHASTVVGTFVLLVFVFGLFFTGPFQGTRFLSCSRATGGYLRYAKFVFLPRASRTAMKTTRAKTRSQ